MDEEPESKTCSRCGGILESGRLETEEIKFFENARYVRWAGPKTGIIGAKKARIYALRCPKCGLVQLESKPNQE